MEWWIILSVGLLALLSLFMSGLPIYLCFLVINVTGVMLAFGQAGFGMFINSILETTNSESLTAVALFIVMGEYLFRSGAIDVAFRSCDTLIGKVRGRQYYLCISLTTFIGALAGSAMGVAAMLGRSLYPAMVTPRLRPEAVDRHHPGRRVAGADHSALDPRHHYRRAGRHLDLGAADRGHYPGIAAVRAVPGLRRRPREVGTSVVAERRRGARQEGDCA